MSEEPNSLKEPNCIEASCARILGKVRLVSDAERDRIDTEFDQRQRDMEVKHLRTLWNAPRRHVIFQDYDKTAAEWRKATDKLVASIGTGVTIGIVGNRGPGKTQMAVEMMRKATDRRRSAYYSTALAYFLRLRHALKQDSEESQLDAHQSFIRPQLLVIDETQVRGDTAWEDNMLVDLVGTRYNAMLDTVLISNQTLDEFQRSMGPSIVDRINQTGGIIECCWESFRK
jgi:DNA replication protein DnaC